jgi:hypothetical protein
MVLRMTHVYHAERARASPHDAPRQRGVFQTSRLTQALLFWRIIQRRVPPLYGLRAQSLVREFYTFKSDAARPRAQVRPGPAYRVGSKKMPELDGLPLAIEHVYRPVAAYDEAFGDHPVPVPQFVGVCHAAPQDKRRIFSWTSETMRVIVDAALTVLERFDLGGEAAAFGETCGGDAFNLDYEIVGLIRVLAFFALNHLEHTPISNVLNWTSPIVESLVDFGYLFNPALSFQVVQLQNLRVRPVKVISNVRYLLIEPL